ncbi:hypothetical protein [Acetobacter ascendens]|uniref:HNH endonuclease n=1 Tax=Acetobacter ascendens TaxID=481146 RepID=A0A1Y0UVJ6_9PROT|nr:hypothetical protein [Acetobacter ascendens]ARW09930.1 hypothetical protein S101447_00828 [Acetobacter ascendens]
MKFPTFTRCQFCGAIPAEGEKLSRTHIWPKWLNTTLEHHPSCDVECIDRPDFSKITKTRKTRHQDIFTIQPRIACIQCNGGWMNNIEQGVLDFLKPIISNDWPQFLTPEQIRKLSLWLALICMNAELASPLYNTITQADRDYIRNKEDLPRGWSIIVAKNHGSYWRKRRGYHNYPALPLSINRRLSGTVDNPTYDKQITTFGIGPLFAQVVSGQDFNFVAHHFFAAQKFGFGILFPRHDSSPLDTTQLHNLSDHQINDLNSQIPWFLHV